MADNLFSGLFSGGRTATNDIVVARQQRLAEIQAEREGIAADKKVQFEQNTKRAELAIKRLSMKGIADSTWLDTYNSGFVPAWNELNPGMKLPELQSRPQKGSDYAKRILDVWKSDQDLKFKGNAISEILLEAQAEGEGIELPSTVEKALEMKVGESQRQALGQGIAGRRQIAETLRTTPELAQTPEALESAKQDVVDLLLAGGVEGRKAALELDTLGQPSADPKTQFDQTKKLRDEFIKASGDFVKLRDSFGKIAASAKDPSAAGDVSMIFAFMKMLDPTSVVREGEQATAANARGIPEGVRTLYNRVISGQRLGENQRKDFVDRAKRIMSVDKERHERRIGVFNNLAKSFDLDPRQVTIDLFDPDINIDELLATSPGTHVPDFDRWMVEARRANPDASEKDLRDFYTNKYGGI